jgi:hypothetical protein
MKLIAGPWSAEVAKVLGVVLNGEALNLMTYTGEPIRDNMFLSLSGGGGPSRSRCWRRNR